MMLLNVERVKEEREEEDSATKCKRLRSLSIFWAAARGRRRSGGAASSSCILATTPPSLLNQRDYTVSFCKTSTVTARSNGCLLLPPTWLEPRVRNSSGSFLRASAAFLQSPDSNSCLSRQ